MITAGRVRVNGEALTELGTQADPDVDRIEVDGEPVRLEAETVYLAMNKPRGYLSAVHDPRGRKTVMELLPEDLPPHVVPVGRLDRDTEGLLLFTNDGKFAHRLAHPRYVIDKEYHALVTGSPSADALEALRRGVEIDGRMTSPAQVETTQPAPGHEPRPGHTWLRVVIHEGRKRQVRRMCAAVGHEVRVLVRTRVGEVGLGRLALGKTRRLSRREVEALKRAVRLESPSV